MIMANVLKLALLGTMEILKILLVFFVYITKIVVHVQKLLMVNANIHVVLMAHFKLLTLHLKMFPVNLFVALENMAILKILVAFLVNIHCLIVVLVLMEKLV